MQGASDDEVARGGASSAGRRDFTSDRAYQGALRLCGLVYDLEMKIPDDERPDLYAGMKRASIEVGTFVASGFGRDSLEAARDLWERARASLMETRHYVLLAQSRYFLDSLDAQSFEALYAEVLEGINALLMEGRR